VKSYTQSLVSLIFVFVLFEGIAVTQTDFLRRPCWGDESHTIATIRSFGEPMGMEHIGDYREVTPPLVYIVYALWGRVAGFDLPSLRILSLMFAFAVFFIFHRTLFELFGVGLTAFLTAAFLMVNPYMIGTSVFVFTDMMTMAFVAALIWAVFRERPLIFFFSAAGALLCRQYTVFLVLAAGTYFLIRMIVRGGRSPAAMIGAAVAAVIPLVSLFALWKGIAPPSGLAYWNPGGGLAYHLDYVSVYVVMSVVYCFPFVLLAWKKLYTDGRLLIFSLAGGLFYLAFPIAPSKVTLEQTSHITVGLFHRTVKTLLPNSTVEHAFFLMLFILGIPVLARTVWDGWMRVKRGDATFALFLDISVVFFYLIMPISYQNWEKYLLPLLPILFMRLLMFRREVV
jgi:4-amino-4-deoxy-L-arabinose transferase-like glycosyltransferase